MYKTALFIVVAMTAVSLGAAAPPVWSEAEQIEFLKAAEVVKNEPAPGGITGSRRLTLSDGERVHEAHFQPIAEPGGVEQSGAFRIEVRHDHYLANLAAYELDGMLRLGMVPVAIERRIDGKRGALSWWVTDSMTEGERRKAGIEPPDRSVWEMQLQVKRVFDQLVDNPDRNHGNLLITSQWVVWLIDHTKAFGLEHHLLDPSVLTRCDRTLLEGMRDLSNKDLEQWADRKRVDALLARRDEIVRILEEQTDESGEASVLYDYIEGRGQTHDAP